jgi:hypothetical protein
MLHPNRGLQAALILVCVVGALSASHRVQAGIAVFVLSLSVLIALTLGLRSDFFVPA